ncbi:hypothetical protein [Agromyces binzhouensis]|uniref:hypothetical protein n=1 Tax=Agromyces binzhouensis TaxID=1817495 RepID=UPI0013EAA0E5|nr:hypothetical protein [Agromyces binzhouensis]
MAIVFAAVVAQALVGGLRLTGHPLATGLGYWARVWLGVTRASSLRRTPAAAQR